MNSGSGRAFARRDDLGLAFVICCVAAVSGLAAQPQPRVESEAIHLLTVEGRVEIAPSGSTNWVLATGTNVLHEGDRLRTAKYSRALIQSAQLGRVTIRESSLMTVSHTSAQTGRLLLRLWNGFFRFFNRGKPIEVDLENGLAGAGTHGTEFLAAANENGRLDVTVFDGEVELWNQFGRTNLSAGQLGAADSGTAPARTPAVLANNIVQWWLYYPAVLDVDELELSAAEQASLAESLAAWRSGTRLRALQSYPVQRQPVSEPERVYLAALFLSVGETDRAEVLLQDSSSPFAAVLRELIAAVQFKTCERRSPPRLATEWVAESYYQQSRASVAGDALSAALKAAEAAVAKAPFWGLAWGRLAELQFSFGRTSQARSSLENALRLSPADAQALALKGFVLSSQNRITEALTVFDQAIAIDGFLADGWLGRGLCRIRQGGSEAGREDLLTAAALEPQRAAFRSYLGKAFSDAGEDSLARQELDLARRLDPHDPTSWLYSALQNQQNNRINDAIADLEQSKALNDNRSVYRSTLLLDQDSAVRSANLARIYQDAGMTEVAAREAARAVNSDYANYSAHYFLAGSYNAMRDPRLVNLRFETAETAEYLLANLLAPVGAGVLSPTISQQEYSKLFERNQVGVISLTEYLSRGAWLESGAQYGTIGNASYSLEGFYRGDRGERLNNDLEQSQVGLLLKQQLTSQDSALLEVSYLNAQAGDLAQRYDQRTADPTFRSRESQDGLVNLGYHHEWGPGIHTLLLAGYLPDRLLFSDAAFPTFAVDSLAAYAYPDASNSFGMAQNYRGLATVYFAEAQQILEYNAHHLSVFGGRFQWGDINVQSTQMNPINFQPFFPPEGEPASVQNLTLDLRRWSVYAYHHWEVFDHFWLVGGLTYDHLEMPENFLYPPISPRTQTANKLEPKAGLIWSPAADTTIRFAYSRSLAGVSLEQSYRLEPAQVAGFTQAYRDLIPETAAGGPTPGAPFEIYGLAFEQKLARKTYFGVSGEILDSEESRILGGYYVDTLNLLNGAPASLRQHIDYSEKSVTATLNQLVGRDWSFGIRYRASQSNLKEELLRVVQPSLRLTNPSTDNQGVLQQFNFDAGFNHPSGLFARFDAVWNQQDNQGYLPAEPGDHFWQFNIWAGYRFLSRKAEVSVGLLNLADRDYRLNPLTPYDELPHGRTLGARLLINF